MLSFYHSTYYYILSSLLSSPINRLSILEVSLIAACLPFNWNKVYAALHLWFRTCSVPSMTLVSLHQCQKCPPAECHGRWKDTDGHVNRLHSTGVAFFGSAEICAQIVVLRSPSPTSVISKQMVGTRKRSFAGHASPTFATNMERKKNKMCAQAICYWTETLDNILPVHFLLPPIATIWRLLCTLYSHGITLGVIMHAMLICQMKKCKIVERHDCQRPADEWKSFV